jgi:hypothetical protein
MQVHGHIHPQRRPHPPCAGLPARPHTQYLCPATASRLSSRALYHPCRRISLHLQSEPESRVAEDTRRSRVRA